MRHCSAWVAARVLRCDGAELACAQRPGEEAAAAAGDEEAAAATSKITTPSPNRPAHAFMWRRAEPAAAPKKVPRTAPLLSHVIGHRGGPSATAASMGPQPVQFLRP